MNSLIERLWPADLAALLRDPRVFAMEPGPYPQLCRNCGGHRLMMVYRVTGGPYAMPHAKSKWLDLVQGDDPRSPSVPGWYDGKLEVAPCPACNGDALSFLRRNSGVAEADQGMSLASFSVKGVNAGKAKARAACAELLAAGRSASGFLTLYGAYGTGKSHLLKAVVNGMVQMGIAARYATLSGLLAEIREKFADGSGVAVEAAVEELASIRVLALDEIGDSRRVNLTGWAMETTFRLLDERYTARESSVTLLASNIEPEHMAPEWGYLRSRLSGGRMISVPGPDMREFEDLVRQAKLTGRPVDEVN